MSEEVLINIEETIQDININLLDNSENVSIDITESIQPVNISVESIEETVLCNITKTNEIINVTISNNGEKGDPGTTDHAELTHLDYDSSGHTGFASEIQLNNKVDKEVGKGLSANDYTNVDKNKLSSIEYGAEVNVNADWNSTSGDSKILNKPNIPTKTSDLINDSGFINEEVDPIFTSSPAYNITNTEITNWNTSYTNTHTHTNKSFLDLVIGTNTGDETTSTIKSKLGVVSNYVDGYLTSSQYITLSNKQDYLGYTPVPNSRTITINGITYDLTANRSWSVGDLLSTGSYSDPSWITSLNYDKITNAPWLVTETDPIFSASPSANITTSEINKWNNDISTAISITYANLINLINGNQLIVGQNYIISDYQTTYIQPVSNVSMFGDIEPIVVMAISTNKLHSIAYSQIYKEDIIYYSIDLTTQQITDGFTKGYIIAREVPSRKIYCELDWRSITFRRYALNVITQWIQGNSYNKGDIVINNNYIYIAPYNISNSQYVDELVRFPFQNGEYASYSNTGITLTLGQSTNITVPVNSNLYFDYPIFDINNKYNFNFEIYFIKQNKQLSFTNTIIKDYITSSTLSAVRNSTFYDVNTSKIMDSTSFTCNIIYATNIGSTSFFVGNLYYSNIGNYCDNLFVGGFKSQSNNNGEQCQGLIINDHSYGWIIGNGVSGVKIGFKNKYGTIAYNCQSVIIADSYHDNVFVPMNTIGYYKGNNLLSSGNSNQLALGYEATLGPVNTLTFGNASITDNYFNGSLYGNKFITNGGTISQFVKGDGTLDSTIYYNPSNFIAGTNYQLPISLTTNNNSGSSTFINNVLNIPTYTLSGLGGQPLLPSTPINPTQSYLNGNLQWAEIAIGSGGNASNIYFNLTNSDVSGYKIISYTPDPTETQYSNSVTNTESLFVTYLGQLQLGVTVINAGTWSFSSYIEVDKTTGVTQLKYEPFVRHLDGSETTLFSVYSDQITNTTFKQYTTATTQNAFTVVSTDRLGVRVYGKTTSSAAVSITRIVGDGRGAYFTTSLPLRHTQLRSLNDDVNNQHVTTTQISNWNNAYTNRITSLTTTGNSGAATLSANILNIPNYTLSGLGGQSQLNGTGFVKASGTTISYDNTSYLPLNGGVSMTGLYSLSGDPTSSLNPVTKQYLDRRNKLLDLNSHKGYEPVDNFGNGSTFSMMKWNHGFPGWPYLAGLSITLGERDTGDSDVGTIWPGSYHQFALAESNYNLLHRFGNVGVQAHFMATWSASKNVLQNDLYIPTTTNSNGFYYKCTTAGTTGTTEPTWPSSGTISDGTVVWTYAGKLWSDWDAIWSSLSGDLSTNYNITASKHITSGGTSSQFLKGDGSLDSNAYYLASNPSGYITSSALSGYATQSWVSGNYISKYTLNNTTPKSDFLTYPSGFYTLNGSDNTDGLSNPTIIHAENCDNNGYGFDIAYNHGTPNRLFFRSYDTTVPVGWLEFIHSGNYNSYSPTLTGTGANGTWGINISGTAANATNWTNAGTYSAISYDSNLFALMGYNQGSGTWTYYSNSSVKSWLGLGSNAYSSTAYLPLAGGTLIGPLNVATGNALLSMSTGDFAEVFSSFTYPLAFNYNHNGNILLCSGTSTGNVGIGTTGPSYKLDVTGSGRFTGNITAPSVTITTGAAANKVLTSDASGNATWQTPTTGNSSSGTYTPSYSGYGNCSNATTTLARYTKINNDVHVYIKLSLTATSGNSSMFYVTVPFTGSGNDCVVTGSYYFSGVAYQIFGNAFSEGTVQVILNNNGAGTYQVVLMLDYLAS